MPLQILPALNYYYFFQYTEGFVTLFVQYFSAVSGPSDRNVGSTRPRIEPGTGGLKAGTLTTGPSHFLLKSYVFVAIDLSS